MFFKDADDLLFGDFFLFIRNFLFLLLMAIVSAAADPEYTTQYLYRIAGCMRLNETIEQLQVCRLKMPKAFFKISRSVSNSRMRLSSSTCWSSVIISGLF